MKTLFTTFAFLGLITLNAQTERTPSNSTYETENTQETGKIFMHLVTSDNSGGGDGSYLDHPLLNGNPNAKPVVSHYYTNVDNNKISGVYYDLSVSKWMIYNEDFSQHVLGANYMVYIPSTEHSLLHISTNDNNSYAATEINHPLLNGETTRRAVVSHVYVSSRSNNNLGMYILDNFNRSIYNENYSTHETDKTYHVAIEGESGIVGYRLTSNEENTPFGCTRLDHPLLNGNPNARLVFSHLYTIDSLDKTLTLYYNDSVNKWALCAEDYSDLPISHNYDFLIYDESMNVNDLELNSSILVYPNPVVSWLTISSKSTIHQISVFNLMGQEVFNQKFNSEKTSEINLNSLPSGNYLVKIETSTGIEFKKIIKK